MIPKTIWQTYKTSENSLPEYAKYCMNTWKMYNPDWEFKYMDDQQIENFVLNEFDTDWYNLFINLPHGVMKADIWRYMVLYKYGGIYTDIDTVCYGPADLWVKQEYDMIVGPEDDMYFGNWIIAANKNNYILKLLLDMIKEQLPYANYEEEHYVHKLTANIIFTKAISRALNINKRVDLINDGHIYNNSEKAKEYKFYCYTQDQAMMLQDGLVHHLFASLNWSDGQYEQWSKKIPYDLWKSIPWVE